MSQGRSSVVSPVPRDVTTTESGGLVPGRKSGTVQIDNVMRITTPENIAFQYEVVGPFRRLFAYLLDLVISLGGYFGLVFLGWMLTAFLIVPLAAMLGLGGLIDELAGMASGLMLIGLFLVYWFYAAWFETYCNGQTLGKRITGMRVISGDGHAIDGVQATLRNFFRLIDLMPMVPLSALFEVNELGNQLGIPTCLFGLIVMTLSPRYQRLGDLVANTVVVNEERKRRPDLEEFEDERVAQLADLIPATFFVSPSMARAIADYTDHRRSLNFQRASEIASYLAVPLLARFGLRPDTDYDLFMCAMYYRVFLQQNIGDVEAAGLVLEPIGTDVPRALTDSSTGATAHLTTEVPEASLVSPPEQP